MSIARAICQWAVVVLVLGLALGCADDGGDDDPGKDVAPVEDVIAGETAELEPSGCTDDSMCDDGDPCTVDSCVLATGECTTAPLECDDGEFCNGVETCDPVAGCVDGTAPVLDDSVVCTVDECNEVTDEVTHTPDDAGCDDGDVCTDEVCDSVGGCLYQNNKADCDDEDPCTVDDSCLEGECAGEAQECDDGLWCNGLETCEADTGDCLDGDAPELDDGVECSIDECDEDNDEVTHTLDHDACDDEDVCTDDVCDPDDGCLNPFNEVSCDDELACTVDDVCDQGVCAGFSKECDDGLYCNGLEACDDANGDCLAGTPPVLDDGVECTVDECDEDDDEVVHLPADGACDDSNPCTDDVCDPELGCLNTANTGICDDLDPCTVDDVCAETVCAGTAKVCDDGLWCNGLETCEADTGDCLAGTPPDIDDTIDCTVDECDEESDLVVNTPDDALCDDVDVCTDDICDVEGMGCVNPFNTSACDDLDPCTVEDVCAEGSCAGAAKQCDDGLWCNGLETCEAATGDCLDGVAPVVSDGIDCTVDECDDVADEVLNTPDDGYCDDNNECTEDSCDDAAGCVNDNVILDCDDLDPCTVGDICGEGVCEGTPKICDDDLFCNGIETCEAGTGDCLDGEDPVIDDQIACTEDSCDEAADEVVNEPIHIACEDDNLCTDNVCDAEEGCTFPNNTDSCDDQEACTEDDVCNAGTCEGGPWICEDCANDVDDNDDGKVDCCDDLCQDAAVCQAEAECGNQQDDDCDGYIDCVDIDCLGSEACGPYPLEGDLVITEVLQNPFATEDSDGEWFELFNVSENTFDLRFMEVSDAEANFFVVQDSLVIGPGEFLLLGKSADTEVNGGVDVDYAFGGSMSLGNADDEIILSLDGVIVDEVAWDGGPDYPDPTGESMQLDVAKTTAVENDVGGNWCTPLFGWGDETDLGSPGLENFPCVELECADQADNDNDGKIDCMDEDCVQADGCEDTDKDGIPDPADKCPGHDDHIDFDNDDIPDGCELGWVGEVWPPTGTEFLIDEDVSVYVQVYKEGVTDKPLAGDGVKAMVLYKPDGPGDYVEMAMVYNKEVGPNDEFMVTIPSFATQVGSLVVDFKIEYEIAPGYAYAFNDAIKDQEQNEAPLYYNITVDAFPPSSGDVVITEILKNPSVVVDTKGEWFEVFNLSNKTLNLDGVTIMDADGESHLVDNGGLLLLSPGAYHVYGNNKDTDTNAGVNLDYQYSGIIMTNGDDEVILKMGDTIIEQVAYTDADFPDGTGISMQLAPASFDPINNDFGYNWCNSVSTYGDGTNKGSPGKDNDQCL